MNKIDEVKHTEIKEKWQIKLPKKTVEEKKLKWYGHIVRMENNRQTGKVRKARLMEKPEEKNQPTWNEEMAKIIKNRESVL